MKYPEGPTDKAQVDSTQYDSKLLGENELGCVHIHGPFGNADSDVKIAYLIGLHPLESKSHRALFENLISKEDLNYCYYLYNINVRDKNSETEGRLEFLDIHSNRGPKGPGEYKITNFVFAPGFDEKSEKFMNAIIDSIDEVKYYAPEFRSSPPYITEPTANAGIPTIVYECFSYEEYGVSCILACKLINIVDDLKF